MITRAWKVYGKEGHKQRESFNPSCVYDFTNDKDGVRIVAVHNSDKTGTNDYSVLITTNTDFDECELEMKAQISDGIFENSAVGKVEEL